MRGPRAGSTTLVGSSAGFTLDLFKDFGGYGAEYVVDVSGDVKFLDPTGVEQTGTITQSNNTLTLTPTTTYTTGVGKIKLLQEDSPTIKGIEIQEVDITVS